MGSVGKRGKRLERGKKGKSKIRGGATAGVQAYIFFRLSISLKKKKKRGGKKRERKKNTQNEKRVCLLLSIREPQKETEGGEEKW